MNTTHRGFLFLLGEQNSRDILFLKITVNSSLLLYECCGIQFYETSKNASKSRDNIIPELFTRNLSYISHEKKNNKGLRKIIIVNGPHMVFFLCVF